MSVAVIEKRDTVLNVQPEGRLDTARMPQLEKEVEPYLADINQIVMDFSKVEYISSSGLRLVMWLEQLMEERGGELQVTHANESVLKVFRLTGFITVVNVVED